MMLAELQRPPWRRHMMGPLLSALLVVTFPTIMAMPAADHADAASATMQPATDNPIVVENQQPGSWDWGWSLLGDDVGGQIKGYASVTSVKQNDSITFHVSVNPTQTFTIDFYRIGWYGGYGARHRLHVGPLAGTQQPACVPDSTTGLIACNWAPSYTLTVPSDWTSGVYTARLTNELGFQNYVVFVVRDGRPAAFLYQHSVTTDHAYNNYPNDGLTGKSLYTYNSFGPNTVSGEPRAVKISFDRPLAGSGFGNLLVWEINLIRWLERSGYDVTYSTNIDTHANGAELQNHKAFLSTGHDEYWSKEMFDAAEAARDAGVNLAFFGANTAYWQVRFESSAAGVPSRTMVGYKQTSPLNPIDPVQGPTTTTYFREPPANRPEQRLVGIMFASELQNGNADYIVTNSSHWVYAGTGFKDGDAVSRLVGYEADLYWPNYPPPNSSNQTLLSHSPHIDTATGTPRYANSSIYQAPSGAWVFASGTLAYVWALDDFGGQRSDVPVDARIQRATANVLNAFLNGAPPAITSFTPASGSAGDNVTIRGANFLRATSVTFNGRAASFTVTSDTAIQTTVPAGATTGPLSVTTPGGTATSTTAFTVVSAPTITSFTPTSGRVGASVTISGRNFTGATVVRLNGTAANFSVTSDSTIQTSVPPGATSGPLSVTTPEGTATSAGSFTVRLNLSVTKTGLLRGTVTSSPAGINCGGTCSADFNSGAVVTLTATPAFLSIFRGWSGCDTVSGNTCTVTMSASRRVTANFLP